MSAITQVTADPQSLDRGSAVPIYVQLEDILSRRIASGEWRPNQRIPSENELTRMYGLSRMTARAVLNSMTNSGLLFRVPGKGTFVAPAKLAAVSPAYRGIREQLEEMGHTTTTELLRAGQERPPTAVREALSLGEDDDVYVIYRRRSAGGEPISLHTSFVPTRLAPGLDSRDLVGEQLCVVLRNEYGLDMSKVIERLEVVTAGSAEARLLATRRGHPLLLLVDTIRDQSGTPFEFSRILFRGDKVAVTFEHSV
ncbi:MAG: GntR family transcriptional regulator [Bifidobacteriaceae bacterium]|nr:GntR family transcriptional regulator [Bifidobacteriaceae bacterium]